MGGLFGHVLSGLAMFLFSLRWLYCTLLRYHLCRRDEALGRPNSTKFRSALTYPFRCKPSAPIEPIIIISLLIPNIAAELYFSFSEIKGVTPPGGFVILMNGQHITLYIFQLSFPIALLMKHYRLLSIPNAEYITIILSQIIVFVSMWYHVYSKTLLETHTHMLMGVMGLVVAGTIFIEMNHRNSILANVVRIASMLCMGTWIFTVGMLLYPLFGTPLDYESPFSLKVMALAFIWNIAASVVTVTLVSIITQMRTRSLSPAALQGEIKYSFAFTTYGKEAKCEQGESLLNTFDE